MVEKIQSLLISYVIMLTSDKIIVLTSYLIQIFIHCTDYCFIFPPVWILFMQISYLHYSHCIISFLTPCYFCIPFIQHVINDSFIMPWLFNLTISFIVWINLLTEVTFTIRQVKMKMSSIKLFKYLFYPIVYLSLGFTKSILLSSKTHTINEQITIDQTYHH